MDETEKRLREEVQKLLRQAEATDKEEDKRYGGVRRGDELPEELQRRETRIARIRKVQTSAGRASARASRERGERLGESATHGKTQYNFTDPESSF